MSGSTKPAAQRVTVRLPPDFSTQRLSDAERRNLEVVLEFMRTQQPQSPENLSRIAAPGFTMRRGPFANIASILTRQGRLADAAGAYPLEASADCAYEVRDVVIKGEHVWIFARFSARHPSDLARIPPTDVRIEAEQLLIVRVHADKVADVWILADELSIARQLGASIELPGAVIEGNETFQGEAS